MVIVQLQVYLLVVVALVFAPTIAMACTSIGSPRDSFEMSDYVFVGKTVTEECFHDASIHRDLVITQFAVKDIWKGDAPPLFNLKQYSKVPCSRFNKLFGIKKTILVYAHYHRDNKIILDASGMCSRSSFIENYENWKSDVNQKDRFRPPYEDLLYLGTPLNSYRITE